MGTLPIYNITSSCGESQYLPAFGESAELSILKGYLCRWEKAVGNSFPAGEFCVLPKLPLPGVDGGVQSCGFQLIGITLMHIDQLQSEITGNFIREKFSQSVVADQRFVIGTEDLMSGSVEDFDRVFPLRIIPLPEAYDVRADGL